MAGKNKYYVVWKGKKPGIYENWNDCKKQIGKHMVAEKTRQHNLFCGVTAVRGGDD